MKRNLKYTLLAIGGITLLGTLWLGLWVWSLDTEIKEKLKTRRFLPPTEFYTAPLSLYPQDLWTPDQVRTELQNRHYTENTPDRPLSAGRFWLLQNEQCTSHLPEATSGPVSCLIFIPSETPDPLFERDDLHLQAVMWGEDQSKILQTLRGNPLKIADGVFVEPQLFAQYLGSTPVLQQWTSLGATPSACLNGVLAIEDAHFLEHGGVSFLGIARAALKNMVSGRVSQGGSTITQQMVKNFFLTSERTMKRKFTEIFMSLLLEMHANKDEIFETYLNIIYMGQSGPFEVRGFGAAAQHYFQKDLSQLGTAQCSLLAAILNSPGGFNPDKNPDAATKRRNRVLDRMNELGFLSADEAEQSKAEPLPKVQRATLWETAPYYIQAVLRELQSKGVTPDGMQIFTGLIPEHQAAAQKAVQGQIDRLEKENARIKKLAEQKNQLEGILLSMDLRTSWITAAVGGRSYRKTQYNRILDGHRQVGSLMKPFVYFAAFENDSSLNPLSTIVDEKFTYKYEGQAWSPENYGKKFFGEVPYYYALKNSLNASTAQIGINAGLARVKDVAERAGARSEMQAFPSLTLGAFELYPTEVLEMYSTLARFGRRITPAWVRSARMAQGELMYRQNMVMTEPLGETFAAEVIGMMKQTVQTGTAAAISRSGFTKPAAGKTGTTSDSRDAWFAGFTPDRLTITWLGYDQKETHGLTGASGPVPIWLDYMKVASVHDSAMDFQWPESVRLEKVQPEGEEHEIELVLPKD